MFNKFESDLDDDRKPGWLELFYDLAVVAALAASNDSFISNPSAKTSLFAVVGLATLFSIWLLTTLIHNRFAIEGVAYRILLLIQMSGILLTAISVNEGDLIGWQGGLIGLGFVLITISGMYALARIQVGQSVPGLKIAISSPLIGALFCFAGTLLSKEMLLSIITLSLVVTMAPILISFLHHAGGDFPLHTDHLRERLGLLFIVAVGETFAHLVGVLTSSTQGADYRFFFLLLIFYFALAISYFDGVFGMRKTAHPRLWRITVFANFILILGITAASDEMAMFASTDTGTAQANSAGLFAIAIGLLLIGLTILEVITNGCFVFLTWVQLVFIAAVVVFGVRAMVNGDLQTRTGILLLAITFISWLLLRVALTSKALRQEANSN